jgi:DNA replication protein DnaC
MAEFPMKATIEDRYLSPARRLGRRLMLELAYCHRVDKALNIVIACATGTGKSYVACALGVAACRPGYKVQYLHTARLLLSLSLARKNGSYLQLARYGLHTISASRWNVYLSDQVSPKVSKRPIRYLSLSVI